MSRFSEAEHIEAKIRIHGREVPFMGIRVDFGVNIPSSAVVQLVPTKTAKEIRPGTVIQAFYKCHHSSSITGADVYKLLFEGELTGKSFQRVEGQKAVSLHCVDFLNYWVHAKQYYMNFQQAQMLSAADTALFAGVGKIQGQLLGKQGRIHSFFSTKLNKEATNRNEILPGFDEVIIDILKDLEGVNKFFSFNLKRTAIMNRIVSASTQKMAESVFKHSLFSSFIKQQMNRSGGTTSMWSLMTTLLNITHHEMVSTPTQSYIEKVNLNPNTDQEDRMDGHNGYWNSELINENVSRWRVSVKAPRVSPTTNAVMIKPNAWNVEPPSCNIFFPSEVESMSFSANYQNKITRFQLIPTSPLFKNKDLTNLTAVFQPNSLHHYIRDQYGKKISKTPLKDIVKGKSRDRLREFDFLTNEELERGIVPGFSSILPGAASMLMSHAKNTKNLVNDGSKKKQTKFKDIPKVLNRAKKSSGKEPQIVFTDGVYEFVHNLAEFEFHRKRAASNQFAAASVFKPMVMAGHPAVFIDDSDSEMSVIAYLSRGSHTIYASGTASTSCDFALARDLNEKVPDFDQSSNTKSGTAISTIPSEAPIPDWFDEKYHHGRIGPEVYARTMGCTGLLNAGFKNPNSIEFKNPTTKMLRKTKGQIFENREVTKLHLQEVREKTKEAIANLRGEYTKSLLNGQHGRYVFIKTFRPVITEEQLYIQIHNGKLCGAKSFMSDSTYVSDIRSSYVKADLFGNEDKGSDIDPGARDNTSGKSSLSQSKVEKVTDENLKVAYPIPGRTIGIDFGKTAVPADARDKKSNPRYRNHAGVDIHAEKGTSILAIESGSVVFTRISNTGYGTRVDIKHGKSGIVFYSVYGHLDKLNVKNGDSVKRGQVIGFVGNSGNTTGHHLHLEFRMYKNERSAAVDPIPHFSNPPNPIYYKYAIRRRDKVSVSRGVHRGIITAGVHVTSVKKDSKFIVAEYPPKKGYSEQDLLVSKTGNSFLALAIQSSFKKDKGMASYRFGAAGPAEIGFDCSGLVFAVAKKYGVSLPRHSLDMYQRGVISISVNEALKTPGAILFQFSSKNSKGGIKKQIKHVGISFGDEVHTLEAYNSNNPVRRFRHGNNNSGWTHAGLLPTFSYGDRKVDANDIFNKTPFAEYFGDITRRLEAIQENRLDIVKKYQAELASNMAFEG